MPTTEWNRKNPERARSYRQKWYAENKDKQWDRKLKEKFGISLIEYDKLLEEQQGVCKICGLKCKSGRRLAVDHCHTTGKVRALLCGNCNKGLGNFQENELLLLKAIEYLKFNMEKYK